MSLVDGPSWDEEQPDAWSKASQNLQKSRDDIAHMPLNPELEEAFGELNGALEAAYRIMDSSPRPEPCEDSGSGDATNPAPTNPKQLYGDRKVPVQQIPPAALVYLALGFREGARKYGAFNWRKTKVESMTYVGAALRHIMAYLDGEYIDPESGNPHLAHAMCCMAIAADAHEGGFVVDNRPPAGPGAEILRKYEKGAEE